MTIISICIIMIIITVIICNIYNIIYSNFLYINLSGQLYTQQHKAI